MNDAKTIQERQKKILRTVRRVVYLGILLGIGLFFWRYDFVTIPENYDHLATQHMAPGATVVAQEFDIETAQVGNVVLYVAPIEQKGHCFGVIAGLPGEAVIVEEVEPGVGRLKVGDRSEKIALPKGHDLHSGVIPQGFLLILNGDRQLDPQVLRPDSRIFGYVPIANVQKRLISALNPFG